MLWIATISKINSQLYSMINEFIEPDFMLPAKEPGMYPRERSVRYSIYLNEPGKEFDYCRIYCDGKYCLVDQELQPYVTAMPESWIKPVIDRLAYFLENNIPPEKNGPYTVEELAAYHLKHYGRPML